MIGPSLSFLLHAATHNENYMARGSSTAVYVQCPWNCVGSCSTRLPLSAAGFPGVSVARRWLAEVVVTRDNVLAHRHTLSRCSIGAPDCVTGHQVQRGGHTQRHRSKNKIAWRPGSVQWHHQEKAKSDFIFHRTFVIDPSILYWQYLRIVRSGPHWQRLKVFWSLGKKH